MYSSQYSRVRRALPYAAKKWNNKRNVHRNAYALSKQKSKKFATVHRYIKKGVKLNPTRYKNSYGKYQSRFGGGGSMFGKMKRWNFKKFSFAKK